MNGIGPSAKTCQLVNISAGISLEGKLTIHSEAAMSATGIEMVRDLALAGISIVSGNAKCWKPASSQNGVGVDPAGVRVIVAGFVTVGIADC